MDEVTCGDRRVAHPSGIDRALDRVGEQAGPLSLRAHAVAMLRGKAEIDAFTAEGFESSVGDLPDPFSPEVRRRTQEALSNAQLSAEDMKRLQTMQGATDARIADHRQRLGQVADEVLQQVALQHSPLDPSEEISKRAGTRALRKGLRKGGMIYTDNSGVTKVHMVRVPSSSARAGFQQW